MNIELTEADVLKGERILTVPRRDGNPMQITCKALSWAAACKVMALADPGEAMLLTILGGVEKDLANDEALNALTPEVLNDISTTILQLTHGVPALKKRPAARNEAQQAMPTSTPPRVSCAPADLTGTNAPGSVRPSSPGT